MVRNIFKRSKAVDSHGSRQRGSSAGQSPGTVRRASQAEPVTAPDIRVDRAMVALSRELSGIARMEVGQAAKERGWAKLQRELERRPVRPSVSATARSRGVKAPVRVGAGAPARGLYSSGRRWVIGSVAAAVAVVAVLLGTYSVGLLTANNGGQPGTVTSLVSSDSTQPAPPSTQGPITTGGTVTSLVFRQHPTGFALHPGPITTGGPVTSESTPPSTQGPITTGGPVTSESTPPSTQGSTTTQPAGTTTTGDRQVAAAQLEKTAKAAVLSLARMVDDYFVTGDMSGARALVASGAQSSLVQMISSLNNPNGYRWVRTAQVSADTVRVTLEFSDRVLGTQGELVEVARRFALTVRVDDESAVITAISAGS